MPRNSWIIAALSWLAAAALLARTAHSALAWAAVFLCALGAAGALTRWRPWSAALVLGIAAIGPGSDPAASLAAAVAILAGAALTADPAPSPVAAWGTLGACASAPLALLLLAPRVVDAHGAALLALVALAALLAGLALQRARSREAPA